jgi:hypothetical protein
LEALAPKSGDASSKRDGFLVSPAIDHVQESYAFVVVLEENPILAKDDALQLRAITV